MSADDLADRLDDALPQTQCTRCGYPDCRSYAQAIAAGEAGINRCPPGGAEGIARLARISGRPLLALDPAHGAEGPLRLALIDEDCGPLYIERFVHEKTVAVNDTATGGNVALLSQKEAD